MTAPPTFTSACTHGCMISHLISSLHIIISDITTRSGSDQANMRAAQACRQAPDHILGKCNYFNVKLCVCGGGGRRNVIRGIISLYLNIILSDKVTQSKFLMHVNSFICIL